MQKALMTVLKTITARRLQVAGLLRASRAAQTDTLRWLGQTDLQGETLRSAHDQLRLTTRRAFERGHPSLGAQQRAANPVLRPRARGWAALIERLRELLRDTRRTISALERDWALGAYDALPCGHADLAGDELRDWQAWRRTLRAALSQAHQAARAGQPCPA